MNKLPGMRLRLCGPRLDGIADELQQFLAVAQMGVGARPAVGGGPFGWGAVTALS